MDGDAISGGAPRARRRRAQAVARPACRGAAEGKPANQRQHSRRAAGELLKGARGHGHNDFKIELARSAIVRALCAGRRGHASAANRQADSLTWQPPISASPSSAASTAAAKVTGERQVCRRVRRAGPRLRRTSSPARSRAGASPPIDAAEARGGRRACCAGLHAREPAAHGLARLAATATRSRRPAAPFRPLHDDKIHYSGQPIALVVAEDLRDWRATPRRWSGSSTRARRTPRIWRANAGTAYVRRRSAAASSHRQAARRCRRRRSRAPRSGRRQEYRSPIEHHNPMEPHATTAIWEGDGKLTVYDKTQGVQNVASLLCQRVRPLVERCAGRLPVRRRRVRLGAAAAIPGVPGRAGGTRAEALGARVADPPADVHASATARTTHPARRARARRRTARCTR